MTDPTPTPPALDLAALTVIAKAATPGPWMAKQGAISPGKKVVGPREASDLARGPIVLMQPIFWDKRSAANADHIAAFDPPTALALIARVEAAEAKVAVVFALADKWERGAMRWEDPLRVPPYVSLVREALGEVIHDPDWGDSVYDDEGPSCSCGFNGTPKECWLTRTALDGTA